MLRRGRLLVACLGSAALSGCQGADRAESSGALPIDSGYVAAEDGVRLFYRSVGDGPFDILIPVGMYLEDALSPLAAEGRRLVFYDPRARGRSEAGDRSVVTLDRQIADMEAVRRGLAIDSMVIIGWSGLGMESAVYAMRHPERVIGLVQVAPVAARDEPHNTTAYRRRSERTDTAAVAAVRARAENGDFSDDPAGYCRAVWQATGAVNFADPAHMAGVPDVCRHPNEHPDSLGQLFDALLPSFQGYDWRAGIVEVTAPRLVIHGRQDAFPVEGSREWLPGGSNGRLLVIDRAGHFPFLERPDVFFPAVEAFLRGAWPEGAEPPPAPADPGL